MKKALPLILLCALLLTACAQEPPEQVNGRAEELQIGPDGLETFVIVAAGEKYGAIVSDKTRVYPQDGMPGEDDFLFGSAPDVMVSVTFEGPETSLTISSGEELKAREAGAVFIYGFLRPDAAALADGTKLDIWQYVGSTAYAAEDGTELLKVAEPVGPEYTFSSNLGETAQANITAWFEARGVLYDEQAELERAYAAWLEAGDASDFQTWGLRQSIGLTALSEGVAYFLTTVERPVGNFVMEQQRIGSAFDRETGEYIEAWELFTCPPEEAVRRILDLSKLTEPEQRAEMEAAFEPECLTFFEDRLEVSFDRGVLPLIQPWAVPQKGSET